MYGEENIMFRPALRGLMKAESLFNGEMSLEQVMLLNEAIDVDDENRYRVEQAMRRK